MFESFFRFIYWVFCKIVIFVICGFAVDKVVLFFHAGLFRYVKLLSENRDLIVFIECLKF